MGEVGDAVADEFPLEADVLIEGLGQSEVAAGYEGFQFDAIQIRRGDSPLGYEKPASADRAGCWTMSALCQLGLAFQHDDVGQAGAEHRLPQRFYRLLAEELLAGH